MAATFDGGLTDGSLALGIEREGEEMDGRGRVVKRKGRVDKAGGSEREKEDEVEEEGCVSAL